jgi:hypothetical protein
MSPRDVIAEFVDRRFGPLTPAPAGVADDILSALDAAGYRIVAVKRVERPPFDFEDPTP